MNIFEQRAFEWTAPCFIEDLAFKEYLQIPAASSSTLKRVVDESPLHSRTPKPPSAAMDLGTLVHALLLEPEKAERQYVVPPDHANKKSNNGKENLVVWMAAQFNQQTPKAEGKTQRERLDLILEIMEQRFRDVGLKIVSQHQMDKAQKMRDSVLSKGIGSVLFESGKAEVTGIAKDQKTGVLCRVRFDWLPDAHTVICDLKTAQGATYSEISRAVARYSYHLQAALYRRVFSLITGEPEPPFLFVVVESEPPYDCAFWELDAEALRAGNQKLDRALHIYQMCEEDGRFPGIGWDWETRQYGIEKISLPKWTL